MRTVPIILFVVVLLLTLSGVTATSKAASTFAVAFSIVLAVWLTVRVALATPSFAAVLRVSGVGAQSGNSVLLIVAEVGAAFLAYAALFAVAFFASIGVGGRVVGSSEQASGFVQFLYFAIVTGSTTGYGDLYPTGVARVIACAEIILVPIVFSVVLQHLRSVPSAAEESSVPADGS